MHVWPLLYVAMAADPFELWLPLFILSMHTGSRLQAEFQQIDSLAAEHFEAPRQFDVATCMFAMHYFFDKPEALKTLLGSIAANLKPGVLGCWCCFHRHAGWWSAGAGWSVTPP